MCGRFRLMLCAAIFASVPDLANGTRRDDPRPVLVMSRGECKEYSATHCAIVGNLVLTNYASTAVCIHADVIGNDLSPHVTIITNGRWPKGLPYPPLTDEVRRVRPGEVITFKQIVGYQERGRGKQRAMRVQAILSAWWCEDDKRPFGPLRSNSLRLPA